jgi:RNA polymerase sigma factor for flagellar operon FliA
MAATTPEQQQKRFQDSLLLVKYVVGRLAIDLPSSLDRDDLEAWGAIGLWRAIQTFDVTRGTAFSTHAYIQIRGAILDELRRLDFLPRTQRDRVRFVEDARRKIEQRCGRPATLEELAEATGLSDAELDEALLAQHTSQVVSIDDNPTDDSGIGALLKTSSDDDPCRVAEQSELRGQLAKAIAKLPRTERQVVTLYYAEGLLLKEIGEVMGFSESRASQVHARALAHLRSIMEPVDAGQAAGA